MLYLLSHPMLPDTYTVLFRIATWAVADQMDDDKRERRRTEGGQAWDGAIDVVDKLPWHGGQRKDGDRANKRTYLCPRNDSKWLW